MRCFASVGVLVTLLAACGESVVQTVDSGRDAGSDAPAVCASSADCANALYCDGVEMCTPGAAGSDARGCVAGAGPCATGETCVEDTESCRTCSIADLDGDGVSGCDNDCDDADAARFPGNAELCDYGGHDEDCDDATYGAKDDDTDGFTDVRCCNGSTCGLDCDDTRGGAHPGVPEVCNGRDDDCNGVIDDGDVLVSGYADDDRDLYGAGPLVMACAGRGLSINDADCDDVPPGGGRASPGFDEVVGDLIDNDCDGVLDETGGPSALWYRDADGDGFGDATDTQNSSAILLGYVLLPGDCDDANAARSPVAAELCNGIDDDCNGLLDFVIAINDWEDDDGDGFLDAACGDAVNDCDDRDRSIHPGAAEPCDGRDNDCGGDVDEFCAAGSDAGVPGDGSVADSGASCAVGAPCVTGNACERGTTDCSSGSAVCVARGPATAGTTCRVSVGVCDLAEACDGGSVLCPIDGHVAAGTVCRALAGACDMAETCTGSGPVCPSDGFSLVGLECRAAVGACDVAEVCTGGLAGCPTDAFAPPGAWCGTGTCGLGGSCVAACWRALPSAGAPAPASGPGGTWTGTELLVWGGNSSMTTLSVGTGGWISTAPGGTWSPTSAAGAPAARQAYAAAWSGSEFFVWGGFGRPGGFLGDFYAFRPGDGTWRTIPMTGGPPPASTACATWTGSDFVVWGGGNGSIGVNIGGRWHPTLGWRATTTLGAPPGRSCSGARVWTGTEFVVWGGDALASGGRYEPGLDSWTALPTLDAPQGASRSAYGWIGGELVVWGGDDEVGGILRSGGVWSSASNTWRPISTVGAPAARTSPAFAVIHGLLVVWSGGGDAAWTPLDDGAAYDPGLDRWYPLPTLGAPSPRHSAFSTAVPDGLALWGGTGAGGSLASGAVLDFDCR